MAGYLPNQPLHINLESFSDAVTRLMNKKGMTQAELAKRSGLSKLTVSRICRNSNDKGGFYTATETVIMALSIGFQLSSEESKKELLHAAFPERAFWNDFLDNHFDIHKTNEILYDNGLPLLGKSEE